MREMGKPIWASYIVIFCFSNGNNLIIAISQWRVHQNFIFSWSKLFLSPPALKHFGRKLNVFGQNFSFSPFSSDLWRKVVFTAEHLLNGQSRLHFCNTLTAARTLPHFDKIIKNTCSLQNVFATQSHWPEYFPILRKSSWFVLTRIKTKKGNNIFGN